MSQHFSLEMNHFKPEKLGAILDLPANQHNQSGLISYIWAKWALLISWQIQNGSQQFDFFQFHLFYVKKAEI